MPVLLTCLLVVASCYAQHGDDVSSKDLAVGGLWTNYNSWIAPPGSLKQAKNVMLERVGMATPRPGFSKSANSNAGVVAKRLFPWQDSLLRVNTNGTTSWWNAPTTPILKITSGSNLSWTDHRERVAAARKNLYLANSDGVRKLLDTSDVVASQSGVTTGTILFALAVSPGPTWLADNSYAAYRTLVARTDANGLTVRGISVGQYVFHNTDGAARGVTGFVVLGFDVLPGDVIELYRTRSSTVIPGNEFYLQSSHTVTAAEAIAKTFIFIDSRADADLGAALYTNDSREGVQGSNFPPPACNEIALFRNVLFFGDTTGPLRFTFKWNEGGDVSGSATGIGTRTYTGTATGGLPTITLASSTVGLKVGQLVYSAAGTFGVTTARITSIVGATITMNANWTGTNGVKTFVFYDSIRIGNSYYAVESAWRFILGMMIGDTLPSVAANGVYYAYSPGTYAFGTTPTTLTLLQQVTVVIEEIARGGTADSVYATHGSEYTPPLPEPGAAADPAAITAADINPGGLSWSKDDEPEHVPLAIGNNANNKIVGVQSERVLRLMASRDALWIFKTDGLWRLSGVSARSGWRIDPFDPTLRLLNADACVVLDDVVYAWTNRGFVAVSDAGVDPISPPIDDQLLAPQRQYTGEESYDVYAAIEPISSSVLLATPIFSAEDASNEVQFVYSTRAKAWSTWSGGIMRDMQHVVWSPDNGKLYGSRSSTADIVEQRTTLDLGVFSDNSPVVSADYQFAVTVTAIGGATGTSITIAGGSGWMPDVGDIITQDGVAYVITASGSTTTFTVHAVGIEIAAAVGFDAYDSIVQWLQKGSATTRARWYEAAPVFDSCAGVYELAMNFDTDVSTAPSSVTKRIPQGYVQPTLTAEQQCSLRVFVPRNAARSATLTPSVAITQAASRWRLTGLGLVSQDISTRVSR